MNLQQKIALAAAALLVLLEFLFPPRFWKIDDGSAWDVTYNLGYAPVPYTGDYLHHCQSATNYGGVWYYLMGWQTTALLVLTLIAFDLLQGRRSRKGLA